MRANGWFEKAAASASVVIGVGVFGYAWSLNATLVQHTEAIRSLQAITADLYTQSRATRDLGALNKSMDEMGIAGRERDAKNMELAAKWHGEDDRRIDALSERMAHSEAHLEAAKLCQCAGGQ